MCEICALFFVCLFVSFLPFAKYEIPTLGTREIRVFFKVLKKISFCGSFLDWSFLDLGLISNLTPSPELHYNLLSPPSWQTFYLLILLLLIIIIFWRGGEGGKYKPLPFSTDFICKIFERILYTTFITNDLYSTSKTVFGLKRWFPSFQFITSSRSFNQSILRESTALGVTYTSQLDSDFV